MVVQLNEKSWSTWIKSAFSGTVFGRIIISKKQNCSRYSHFPWWKLLTLAFARACVYVRVFPLSALTIRLRKYVRIKARLQGSLWSVHPTFQDNHSSMPGVACSVSERAAEPWKGITAPGVFREKHGHVALAGECCYNTSALAVGGQRSRWPHHQKTKRIKLFLLGADWPATCHLC